MKILILGGDGYLGWPTAMYLSNRGYEVLIVDDYSRKKIANDTNSQALIEGENMYERCEIFHHYYGKRINFKEQDLKDFDQSLNKVLLNLAKRVVADGEGASKFITVKINDAKNDIDAKKIAFSIANSPLVKTAIAGEDPNWGRIIMAIGKSQASIKLNKLSIKFGKLTVVQDGKIHSSYNEEEAAEYMKNSDIEIIVKIGTGNKNFTAYTMDLTKKYIEINADYRS